MGPLVFLTNGLLVVILTNQLNQLSFYQNGPKHGKLDQKLRPPKIPLKNMIVFYKNTKKWIGEFFIFYFEKNCASIQKNLNVIFHLLTTYLKVIK